ncbi:hypothetical protein L4D77_25470 [Photobacterium frigidiphilum]|uniref:hypothetical protein n=1 Tax=Photobacterium frigidiphilum TaxID=264736 RepID=UPI001475F48F|nr:hypothetical protein [Photobacterium frigidiphilum]
MITETARFPSPQALVKSDFDQRTDFHAEVQGKLSDYRHGDCAEQWLGIHN